MPNLPNFHDSPDGSSSINHTGEDFWVGIDHMDEMSFTAGPIPPPPSPPPVNFEITENPFIPPLTLEEAFRRHAAALPPTEEQREVVRRPVRIITEPYQCSPPPLAPPSPGRSRRRREISDPDAAIRKDPNAWSLREAVELCKLLEVVLPEAGFHIALTGGLLHKEGRQHTCDLLFYQIRQVEPNYEVLWKYLTVAGVIRDRGYSENSWLVKATYRGKAIDCLFPNVKKVTVGELSTKQNAYQASVPTPVAYDHTREATSQELIATEAYLRERRERGGPEIRSNADIIDAAIAANLVENPATIPELPF